MGSTVAMFKLENSMNEIKIIGWFTLLVISVVCTYNTIGYAGLTAMFPEGKMWWHLPVQMLSLLFYTVVVLNHPWR